MAHPRFRVKVDLQIYSSLGGQHLRDPHSGTSWFQHLFLGHPWELKSSQLLRQSEGIGRAGQEQVFKSLMSVICFGQSTQSKLVLQPLTDGSIQLPRVDYVTHCHL